MNTEQKAKAYDKAIEQLRTMMPNWENLSYNGKTFLQDLVYVFPELRESEDERIRKELIEHIKANCETGFVLFQKFSPDDVIAWLEKQGEKNPADKIAPKFHEGDWIISNNKKSIYQVIEVKRGIYVVRDNADNHEYHIGIEECEKSGRLWTIQDAKDDDVLVHNGITFIFKGIEDGIVKGLCSELSDSILNFGEPEHDKDYYPATKEQRDLLFQKMHEAGYMWDYKSKQLLSLKAEPSGKQKPAKWSEEDEKVLNTTIAFLDEFKTKGYENAVMCIDWIKSLKERIGG